nr:EF HAND 1 calcium binding site [Hymenolepis microstoma]
MTDCRLTGESFVNFVFTPTIGVLSTKDVDDFLASNNLTFTELIAPFTENLKDVFMKDGNNIVHIVKKLCVRFININAPSNPLKNSECFIQPSHFMVKNATNFNLNGRSINIPFATPWFETWRHMFLSRLGGYEHEFLSRYLGCIFVVSTRNRDPLGAFSSLVQQHLQLTKSQPNRWFSQSQIIKFFVLVNDSDMMSPADSNKIFQSIGSTYGNTNCYFLNLTPTSLKSTVADEPVKDIWIPYLLPHGFNPTEIDGNSSVLKPELTIPHGEKLSPNDHEKIRAFVEDFVSRILVPWSETTIRILNEQTSHRLRKTRGFFSVTRKLFSQTNLNDSTTPSLTPSQSDSNVSLLSSSSTVSTSSSLTSTYPDDAPEQQMRRLADLLFLFQQYESAHQIYDLLKKDFKQRSAWLHYAGTQEMSAMSTYLQGAVSQRQYPQHQMDEAIITYVTKCKNSDLALRAMLLHTEALKSRQLFAEMAVCCIRLADIDSFLTGGLLLEQAAYCSLRGKRPLLRHFAMRLALAGVRFARAKQPHLSARSFSLALEILSPSKNLESGWTLALDHINENLARQQVLLYQSKEALESLWHLLSPGSSQLEPVQARFLQEFLTIFNQVKSSGNLSPEWPELSLPVFDKQRIKVMLGAPVQKTDEDSPIEARGTAFSDDEHDDAEDFRIYTTQWAALPSNFVSQLFPTMVSPTDIPAWMMAKDSPTLETWKSPSSDQLKRPGEDFIRYLYSRPSYPLPRQAIFRRLRSLISLQSSHELPRGMADNCLLTWTGTASTRQKYRKHHHWHCVPIGEQVTAQIPLHNTWKVPLVLTDLHLLWKAKFKHDSSSDDEVEITNENVSGEKLREAKTFVQTSVINEFYMLPGDKKFVELSLQPRSYVNDLQLTGVAFKLDITSPRQSSLSNLPSPIAPNPPNITASLELLAITPQLDVSVTAPDSIRDPLTSLNFHGENLPGSGVGSSSVQGKAYFLKSESTDDRFHWSVIQPRGLLKVYFGGFPQSLFEGEIYSNTLTFTNAGSSSLSNLQVATSWPSFFILSNTIPAIVTSLKSNVPLEARESRLEQFWMRGPTALTRKIGRFEHENGPLITHTLPAPTRQLHLVFGYSALNEPASLRFLQHEASIHLLPSVQFTATCARTQGSDIESLIITLRCKNVSLQHTFSVFQLACLNDSWNLELISPKELASTQNGLLVQPAQEMTLCILANRLKVPLRTTDSNIVLDAAFAKINPMSPPYSQFFEMSVHAAQMAAIKNDVDKLSPEAPETDLQPKNFYLLALWRYVDTTLIDTNFTENQRLGQSHIRVVYAHPPRAHQSSSGNNLAQMLASIPSLLPLSSILRLRLHHPSQIVHKFSHDFENELIPGLSSYSKTSSMAMIPVTVEIYNASSCPVTARLSTNEDTGKNQLASQPIEYHKSVTSLPPRVLWAGASVRQISLEPGQTHKLAMNARVACPGVYEVNSLCLKASTQSNGSDLPSRPHSNDSGIRNGESNERGAITKNGTSTTSAPFVRQLCDFSSLVVVMGAT